MDENTKDLYVIIFIFVLVGLFDFIRGKDKTFKPEVKDLNSECCSCTIPEVNTLAGGGEVRCRFCGKPIFGCDE